MAAANSKGPNERVTLLDACTGRQRYVSKAQVSRVPIGPRRPTSQEREVGLGS